MSSLTVHVLASLLVSSFAFRKKHGENVSHQFGLASGNAMSKNDLEKLQQDVYARFDTFTRPDSPNDPTPLMATTVRLAFHDCAESESPSDGAGICDGCIHADDEDHAGLEYGAVYPLEQVFQNSVSVPLRSAGDYTYAGEWKGNPSGVQWSSSLSRADFWQLAALLAIERGNDIAYIEGGCKGTVGPTSSEIEQMQPIARAFGDVANLKYYTGRQDCAGGTPFSASKSLQVNPFWNFEDVHNFFATAFPEFTKQDSVAIMGAHTFGRAHADIPVKSIDPATNCCGGKGFDGSWKEKPNTWTHEYYVDSYFITWEQVQANQNWDGTPAAGIDKSRTMRQYKHNPNEVGAKHQGLMLNTDMVLYYDVLTEDTTTGEEMCSVYDLMFLKEDPNSIPPPCPAPDDFKQPHQEGDVYHQFDAMWKEDFWKAWEKLTTNGYSSNQLNYYEKARPAWTELVNVQNSYEVWGLTSSTCDLQRLHKSSEGSFKLSGKQAYVLVHVQSEPSEANNQDVTFSVYAWLGNEAPTDQQHAIEQFAKYVEQYAKVVYLDPHGSHCRGKCRAEPTAAEKAQWVGLYEIFRTEIGQDEQSEAFERQFSKVTIDGDGSSVSSTCPAPAPCELQQHRTHPPTAAVTPAPTHAGATPPTAEIPEPTSLETPEPTSPEKSSSVASEASVVSTAIACLALASTVIV